MKKIISVLLVFTIMMSFFSVNALASEVNKVNKIKDKGPDISTPIEPQVDKTKQDDSKGKKSTYIVKFSNKAKETNIKETMDKLNKKGSIKKENKKLKSVVVNIDEATLSELQMDESVEYIEANISFEKQDSTINAEGILNDSESYVNTSDYTWNALEIKADSAHQEGITGKGVKVAILDTGVSKHQAYSIAGKVNFVEDESTSDDLNGHGTAIAGIIAGQADNNLRFGIAPEAEIYSVKVLNKDGIGKLEDIIEGIEWAIDNEMNIINMSFGSYINSRLLKEAINLAYSNNIILIASSGNKDSEEGAAIMYPAAYQRVVAVGAVDENKQLADYSCLGDKIEVLAPGSSIYTTVLGNSFDMKSGTSMAAAHVSGVAALLWSRDLSKVNGSIRGLIQESAITLDKENISHGGGLVNIQKCLELYDNYMSNYILNSELEGIPEEDESKYDAEVKYSPVIGPEDNFYMQGGSLSSPMTLNAFNVWGSGSISYVGEEDYIGFTAPISGTYTIETSGSTDTVGTLYNSAGTQVAYNDDTNGVNFVISYYIEEGWYVKFKINEYGNNATGSYSLKVTTPFPSSTTQTMNYPTNFISQSTYTFSYAGSKHWISFTAPENGTYTFETTSTSSNLDTVGAIYDYNMNKKDDDDDSGDGTNFSMNVYMNKGYKCYIRVWEYGNDQSGSYNFKISINGPADNIGDSASSAYNIGTTLSFSRDTQINHSGDVDYYKFTVYSLADVSLGLSSIPANCDYELKLYDGNQSEVGSSTNGSNTSESISKQLMPGTYYIKVYSYSGYHPTDGYYLSLSGTEVKPQPSLGFKSMSMTYVYDISYSSEYDQYNTVVTYFKNSEAAKDYADGLAITEAEAWKNTILLGLLGFKVHPAVGFIAAGIVQLNSTDRNLSISGIKNTANSNNGYVWVKVVTLVDDYGRQGQPTITYGAWDGSTVFTKSDSAFLDGIEAISYKY